MIVRLSPGVQRTLRSLSKPQLLAFARLLEKVVANPTANSEPLLHTHPVQRCAKSGTFRLTIELRFELEDPDDRGTLALILYLVECRVD